MRIFLPRLLFVVIFIIVGLLTGSVSGQSGILDPNDPIVTYNEANPPKQPAFGQVAKWVKTNRLNWNTSSYKAYIYKGMAFRLKFPKSYQHGVADGKTYPVMIFFHGVGEKGSIYDNEFQLYHGGEVHRNAVDNGKFDGFLIYPQNTSGFFNVAHYDYLKELVENIMVPQVKADINRIYIDGLSGGGTSAWDFMFRHPKFTAACLPISSASVSTIDKLDAWKYIPVWHFQGALDNSPHPNTSHQLRDAAVAGGANYTYTEYPDQGHGCWYAAWAENDFYPFLNRAHKANPWPLFGRTEFCPGDAINVTLGLTEGFDGYEWRKNGSVIAGATGNTLVVTTVGVYDARVKRGNEWSVWSPRPTEIKLKAATVPPGIEVSGLMSKVIPALDDNAGVTLAVPQGYASYLWQKVGSTATIGTANTLNATSAGDYIVKVTEQFGCSSAFSTPFTVVNANGTNKPDAAISLTVGTLSKTSLRLDWNDNPAPAYNETNFEIYQASQAGGPYKLIGITGADVLTYIVNNLNANTKYFFKVRAVNSSAAAAASNEAAGTTGADTQAPTAPTNLVIATTTRNSVSLSWTAATDDVGVTKYDVYINGQKAFVTASTTFTVYNLETGRSYNFAVKARDFANNVSAFSNQVTGQPLLSGLNYKYYTYTGSWSNLPDFNTLTPVATGMVPNVTIANRTQNDKFAFIWEGVINIPVDGTYTFRTNSDDGSKLYLGTLNQTASPYNFAAIALVNNDGLHAPQDRDGTITLTAGTYPIAVTFYEEGGGEVMTVSWKTPQTGGNFVTIPNSAFADAAQLNGQAPSSPSALVAAAVSYKRIDLSWTDNSSNESGFEIWRSTDAVNGFITVGTVKANVTSFTDSSLDANTKYYYRVRAIGEYGESGFDSQGTGVSYSYYENTGLSSLPDFNALTPKKTGRAASIGLGVQDRGEDFQLKFSGTINIPATGLYTFYTSSDDGSKLYIDGFDDAHLVVNNDGLHGTQEKVGLSLLTKGPHTIYVTFFERGGGEVLTASISGLLLPKQLIPASMLGEPFANATTSALPSLPAAASNIAASGVSTSAVQVTWKDNATNEEKYELYRSANTNGNYVLLTSLPANTVSYKDSALFANAVYYYKVKAVNIAGSSAFSAEDSAVTGNNLPLLNAITAQYMRYGTQLQLNIEATDLDPEVLEIAVSQLPSFASLTQVSNGKALITFNPAAADQGTYTGIKVTVTDRHAGTATALFNLTVNNNYNPKIPAVADISVNEKQVAQVNLTASDPNASDALTWSFVDLPSFATAVTGTGTAQLTFAPGYADAGRYRVMARIEDGNNGFDTASFSITVTDVNLNQKVYIDFGDGSLAAPAPWNNTSKVPALNDNFANLKDDAGVNSGIGLQVMTAWQSIGNGTNVLGATTGNNSGVYPDNVMRSAYYSTTAKQTLRIYGLNVNAKYNFTFFGSRGAVTDDRTSVYTIKGTSASLNATANTKNTVSINGIVPNADGTLTLDLKNGGASAYSYLNAMIIESVYDDGTVPAKARNFAARLAGNQVALTWQDVAYNEAGYEVYRAEFPAGPYSILNPVGARNAQQYQDASVTGNKTYYYTVRAFNSFGSSAFSDTIAVTTPNTAPVLGELADQAVKNDQVADIMVSATDNAGDIITLAASGLPAFATFTDNGNGNGVLHLAPTEAHIGSYTGIVFTATDNKGAATTKTISITVSNKDMTAPLAPGDLQAVPVAKTAIQLTWTDRSSNETGYQVYRAASQNGIFALVATTGANTISYADQGLSGNTTYWYKVRAISNTSNSAYSSVVSASTFSYQVFVNFNRDNPASAPWNNTNNVPQLGSVYANLVNDQSNPTGIDMTITKDFSGENPFGMNTGDNSGVFPDNVIRSTWWLDAGVTSQLKISGLSQAMTYSFVFFGSRSGTGNRTTVYTVNGKSVSLNAANNVSQSVKIDNIKADENGEVFIDISLGAGSSFGYIGALVIQASNAGIAGGQNATTVVNAQQATNSMTISTNETAAAPETRTPAVTGINKFKGYPNPFREYVNLSANFEKTQAALTIRMVDLNGRVVYTNQLKNVAAGNWNYRLDLSGKTGQAGMYMIQLVGSESKVQASFMLLKMK